ncbi:vWA domain-containing protein [Idiomarina abyssalis]|uniref:vWA domain-containing protein n=1 Tax=Idiomarina abyssalis TaxID=86102 RepID=UPI003A94C384
MSELKKFQSQTARPLPVIILADTSASMSVDGKITALNSALKEMLNTFASESRLRAEIQVSVITFGGVADMHLPLTPAHQIEGFEPLPAIGGTPMGAAFKLAAEMIEDKERISSRAYKPVVVLVSDGYPTDDIEVSFQQLMNGERSSKATRFAMGIGADADSSLLESFANDLEAPVFSADNARDIHRFFKAVTMSVTTRSRSTAANQATPLVLPPANNADSGEFEELDF